MRRWVLGVVLLALLASACASPRNALGAGSTACFKVIPVAVREVNHIGRLVGVREVNASKLAKRRPEFARLGSHNVCLFAFQGTYRPGDVPGASPPPPGRFAVVAVNPSDGTMVGAFVLAQLPFRFRHPI
jgi:hypothetical protein